MVQIHVFTRGTAPQVSIWCGVKWTETSIKTGLSNAHPNTIWVCITETFTAMKMNCAKSFWSEWTVKYAPIGAGVKAPLDSY